MRDQKGAPPAESGPLGANRRQESVAVLLAAAGALLLAVSPSVPMSVAAMALLVAGFALQPALGPALLGFVLPFYLMPRKLGATAFSMPELILLCAILGATLHVARRWRGGERLSPGNLATPLDWPVALFLGASILSLLASEVLRVSLRDLRTLVLEPVVAYYLAAWLLRGGADRRRLLEGLLLGGGAAATMGLYQYFFTDYVVAVEGSRRILGPYLSPNHLGLYLGRILPMALAVALFLPGVRVPTLFLSGLLAAALLLTFSLGAWIASTLTVACVLLLWRTTRGRGNEDVWGRGEGDSLDPRPPIPGPRPLAWALGAALVAVLAVALPLLNVDRVVSHFSLSRGTSFIRLQLWDAAFRMIRDHPLLGVGMDNFLYHYRSSYLPPEAAAEPDLSHPHNLLLNFWLQLGLLGIAAAAWLGLALARTWHRLWREQLDRLERAALAGLAGAGVALVVHGMVDNSYFLVDLAFHFWLSAGLLVVIHRDASS